MRRLRVAEIMEATTGGTRRHLADLVTHLDQAQFEVSVVCSNLRDASFNRDLERFQSLGIEVSLVPMVREVSPREDWRSLQQLMQHFREREYDVIHAHSAKAGALTRWAARWRGAKQKAKIIYTPHVFPFVMQVSRPKRWFYLQVEKLSAPFTHHWIAVSETDHAAALSQGICRPDQITRIPNGVNLQQLKQVVSKEEARRGLGLEADAFIVGTVGRLTRQKDPATLIKAMPAIVRAMPRARLLLVGEGENRSSLAELARDLHVERHVRFAGYREDIENLYPAMDVFVLASLWEGCPYTLMEAMYCKLPVIATDIPGNREVVIDGRTGTLVPPSDSSAIHRAVMQFHQHPEICVTMGEAGRRHVEEKFALERMIGKTAQVYLRAAET